MTQLAHKARSLMRRATALLPARTGLHCLRALSAMYGQIEPEILHLPGVMKLRRTVIDIGANNGVTASTFSKNFESVHAFEANPYLAEKVSLALPPHATLWPIALSNSCGSAELRIPTSNGVSMAGWASLDRPAVGTESTWDRITVETRTLDSFEFTSVDLIKIDVEGHELSVLSGARDTIERERPLMIVEVWEEHRSSVISLMSSMGFSPVALKDLCGVVGAPNNIVFKPDQ
jgi:FkbM family methyltransferase